MENVLESQIHSIIIFDHAPLSIIFSPSVNIHMTKQWRFNNSLLKDAKREVSEFNAINLNSGPLVQIVWEALVTLEGA